MALAIDASTPAKATGTGTAITTVSFTPPNGSLVLLGFGSNNTSVGTDTSISSVTNTGTAITWTRRARKNTNASSTGGAGTAGGAEIWTGVGNGGAITVTANGVGSGVGFEKYLQPVVLTSADTTSLANVTAAFSTSGTVTLTLASCLAGSYVFSFSSDWAQKGLITSIGSGQTVISEHDVTGQITIHGWRTTSVLGAGGSQTMNIVTPTAQQFNQVAIEIRDSGGAAAARLATATPNRARLIRASHY